MRKMMIVMVILALGLLTISACTSASTASTTKDDASGQNTDTTAPPAETRQTKTFVITGENFKFNMGGKEAPELRVKEGDTVRIEFTSTGGLHDWTIDEFGAATQRVNTGGSTFVEFVADKKGTFEYYCSVGSHRQLGMRANLIVE